MNLRKALPNASFIGFTGTPLFKDDELTRRIFGEYVSKYDFKRSIEDGATVPLYYENRGEKLRLDNPIINEQIREAIKNGDEHLNEIKIPYNNMGNGGRWWWDDAPINTGLLKELGEINSQSTQWCFQILS